MKKKLKLSEPLCLSWHLDYHISAQGRLHLMFINILWSGSEEVKKRSTTPVTLTRTGFLNCLNLIRETAFFLFADLRHSSIFTIWLSIKSTTRIYSIAKFCEMASTMDFSSTVPNAWLKNKNVRCGYTDNGNYFWIIDVNRCKHTNV